MNNFHPELHKLLTFRENVLLTFRETVLVCPFCLESMREFSNPDRAPYFHCDCSRGLLIFPFDPYISYLNAVNYYILINKKLHLRIEVNFDQRNATIIGPDIHLRAPHLNFPLFNEMAMRHKIKRLLPFL